MNTSTRVFVTMTILVALIAGLYVFSDWFSKTTGYLLGDDQKARLVECLQNHGAVLYENSTCSECWDQQKILGKGPYSLIKKTECEGSITCSGLRSIPAWEIDGAFYYGKKSFKQLSDISGCTL